MESNIKYTEEPDKTRDAVLREISRAARRAHSTDGTPLYDALVPYSGDYAELDAHSLASLLAVVSNFSGVVPVGLGKPEWTVEFFAPDAENPDLVPDAVHTYVVYGTAAYWFFSRNEELAKYYTGLRDAAMERLTALVLTRKLPSR